MPEQGDFVGDRRATNPLGAQAGLDRFGKRQFRKIAATRLDNEAGHRAFSWVQKTVLDQPSVQCCLKQLVMNGVVHVPINVIVRPTGLHVAKHPEVAAAKRLGAAHRGHHEAE